MSLLIIVIIVNIIIIIITTISIAIIIAIIIIIVNVIVTVNVDARKLTWNQRTLQKYRLSERSYASKTIAHERLSIGRCWNRESRQRHTSDLADDDTQAHVTSQT